MRCAAALVYVSVTFVPEAGEECDIQAMKGRLPPLPGTTYRPGTRRDDRLAGGLCCRRLPLHVLSSFPPEKERASRLSKGHVLAAATPHSPPR
ncbi:hypothetical protein E2C01_069509 [Portunus trituberculatus]|uniref:Uncharacterized protein n=1 Tax=Portunus trituberculatus TaxID=210409 RepID=A0A5B7I303_PORTR|nr:hypothetical protein [Portunus trituberculatus]